MFAFWNPSRLPVSCVIALQIYIKIGGGGGVVRVCIGCGKGLFQIDLIHSLVKGCFPCVVISKIISL